MTCISRSSNRCFNGCLSGRNCYISLQIPNIKHETAKIWEKDKDKNILEQEWDSRCSAEKWLHLRLVNNAACRLLTLTWIRRRPLTNCPRLPIRDLKIFDVDGSDSNPDDSSNSVWEFWPAGPVLTRHTTIQVHQVISALPSILWKEELHSFLVIWCTQITWFCSDAAHRNSIDPSAPGHITYLQNKSPVLNILNGRQTILIIFLCTWRHFISF